MYFELGKTAIGALLVTMGILTFVGGLQLEGWYRLLSLLGMPLVGAVVYDTILRNLLVKG